MLSPGACVTSDLSLDHGRPLCPEHLHRLEDVHHALIAHSLQDDAEGDEDSGPTHAGAGNTWRPVSVAGYPCYVFLLAVFVTRSPHPLIAKIERTPSNMCTMNE